MKTYKQSRLTAWAGLLTISAVLVGLAGSDFIIEYLSAQDASARVTADNETRRQYRDKLDQRMEQMEWQLRLTPQQQARIMSIEETMTPDMTAILLNRSLSNKQKIMKMRTIRATTYKRIQQVLTPVQQRQYNDYYTTRSRVTTNLGRAIPATKNQRDVD